MTDAPYTYPRDRIRPTKWLMIVYVHEFRRSHRRYPRVYEIATAFGVPQSRVYALLKRRALLLSIQRQRRERVNAG